MSAVLLAAAISVVLWEQPSVPPESVSFEQPARGVPAPVPPFRFESEDLAGNSPKLLVKDASGRLWQVKGGLEGRADAFLTRLVSAIGYYADSVVFLAKGRIEGVRVPLQRASGFVKPDGTFTYAAFELRDNSGRYLAKQLWTWTRNPFTGTQELRALKLLVMLVSNWDNKDGRDAGSGSNTGIMETETSNQKRHVYFVNDWGQSLGSWGYFLSFGRSNWNCHEYSQESAGFVHAGPEGLLRFGYRGQHTNDFKSDITQADARWLLRSLERISPTQIRNGLKASGASLQEENCFARAFAQRVQDLKRAADERSREIH